MIDVSVYSVITSLSRRSFYHLVFYLTDFNRFVTRIISPLTSILLFLFFVRDGIHSVADYNSTLMGVVLVVILVVLVV